MNRIILLLLLFLSLGVRGQEGSRPFTVHIEVRDSRSKMPVDNAYILEKDSVVSLGNQEGILIYYASSSQIQFRINAAGYGPVEVKRKVNSDTLWSFELNPLSSLLQEIVVGYERKERLYLPSKRIDGLTLNNESGKDLAEILRGKALSNTISAGGTIHKPILQGLTGNRLLILSEGVRLSGQQWGFDHAPEVQTAFTKELVVVKGASAMIYGPEALSGAIVVSKGPIRKEKGWQVVGNQGLNSNGRGIFAAYLAEGRVSFLGDLAWRVNWAGSRSGDLKSPDYFLNNTAASIFDWGGKMEWMSVNAKWKSEIYYSKYLADFGLLRASQVRNLTDLELAIERGNPLFPTPFSYEIGEPRQSVLHEMFKSQISYNPSNHQRWLLSYSRQVNFRDEFDIQSSLNSSDLRLSITTHLLDVGYSFSQDQWTSETRIGGMWQTNTYQGRFFIPNYQRNSWFALQTLQWESDRSLFCVGLRTDADYFNIYLNENGEVEQQSDSFSGFSGWLSVASKPNSKGNWNSLSLGRVFRAPSVYERFVNGIHHGQASYEIGNARMGPERSVDLQLEIHRMLKGWKLEVSPYLKYVQGFMQTIPGEPILTIRGAYPAFNFDQTIALISGLDIFLDRVWNLNNNKVLTYNGMVSFLYHRDLERGEALYFMPGNSLWNELSLQFSKALNLSISNQWIFQQKLIPTTYMDYAPPPPTYTLVGAAIAYSYKYKWRLRISVDNAFNQKYRDFLDRFRYFADASGTNLKVQWTFYFNSKTN